MNPGRPLRKRGGFFYPVKSYRLKIELVKQEIQCLINTIRKQLAMAFLEDTYQLMKKARVFKHKKA